MQQSLPVSHLLLLQELHCRLGTCWQRPPALLQIQALHTLQTPFERVLSSLALICSGYSDLSQPILLGVQPACLQDTVG